MDTQRRLQDFLLGPEASLRDAMALVDRSGKGIVVVVDEDQRCLGTVTDGDLRRAVLAGTDLAQSLREHLAHRPRTAGRPAFTAPVGTPAPDLLDRMNTTSVRHLPLVDPSGRVVNVALLSELARIGPPPMRAVVMAGGKGHRLLPLTADMPKPMLPLDDRPVLEHLIARLREAGVRRVDLATHHLAHVIEGHFGDGSAFGLDIRYVHEDHPLGTAGALARVEPGPDPLLVVNGDIVTRVDLRALRAFHDEHEADLTVAVQHHQMAVPYGVLDLDGVDVRAIREKPVIEHFVAAGIYLLGRRAHTRILDGDRTDMPDLVRVLVGEGLRVIAFPVREYWIDIGRIEDYERARTDAGAVGGA